MQDKPVLFNKKEECSGCAACEAVCVQRCIRMFSDEQGFLYPEINYEQCVGCFYCIKVCPLK